MISRFVCFVVDLRENVELLLDNIDVLCTVMQEGLLSGNYKECTVYVNIVKQLADGI